MYSVSHAPAEHRARPKSPRATLPASPAFDYDCRGNGRNGPRYVDEPDRFTGYDPCDLDRDGDEAGCDP